MMRAFETARVYGLVLGASAALMCCKGEPATSSEYDLDNPWTNEELASTTQGLYKGAPGALNGDWNYCDGVNLCVGGEGDCDSNAECTGGAVCGKDNGAAFGMPKSYDVCVAPHCIDHLQNFDETGADCGGADCGSCDGGASCTGTNGDLDFCVAGCPCGQGQGDCDYDSDCQAGLVCKRKIGDSFGLPATTDVCVAAHCRNAKPDADETGKDCGGADCQACPPPAGPTTLVGNFNVINGPAWGTNPPSYSCVEACALLFGAGPTYHCSTQQNGVDFNANLTIWGVGGCSVMSETAKQGNPNYNCGSPNCSFSAYTQDNCNAINYCWK